MDFQEEINALGRKCQQFGDKLSTEEATKNTLVMPFIKLLGYDPFDPTQVVPEYSAPIGSYKDARVDYALMRDGQPVIIIECKAYGTVLDEGKCNQLRMYFNGTNVRVAVLTDGNRYLFFSDLDADNVMDSKPYMEFVLTNPDPALMPELKKLTHDKFDVDEATSSAVLLKYTRDFKRIMAEQLKQPDEEFVRFFLHKCYDGKVTSSIKDRFTPILRDALALFIRDKINERLQSAIDDNNHEDVEEQAVAVSSAEVDAGLPKVTEGAVNGIVTTQDEVEGFATVKSLLHGVVDLNKVFFKDYKGFSSACFSGTRCVIVRFYFNDAEHKQIGLPKIDGGVYSKDFDVVAIDAVSDIMNYVERIRAVATFLATDKADKADSE